MACECPYVPEVAICASMAWTAQKVARTHLLTPVGLWGQLSLPCIWYNRNHIEKQILWETDWPCLHTFLTLLYLTTDIEATLCPMNLDIRRLSVTKRSLFSWPPLCSLTSVKEEFSRKILQFGVPPVHFYLHSGPHGCGSVWPRQKLSSIFNRQWSFKE